mmetsp:Transcript_21886/g.29778  ORF Transcript_21886/g.29778 Transcript_21886/m.29778 type:complete len:257 (+) Transcript_21886:294-1064(+)
MACSLSRRLRSSARSLRRESSRSTFWSSIHAATSLHSMTLSSIFLSSARFPSSCSRISLASACPRFPSSLLDSTMLEISLRSDVANWLLPTSRKTNAEFSFIFSANRRPVSSPRLDRHRLSDVRVLLTVSASVKIFIPLTSEPRSVSKGFDSRFRAARVEFLFNASPMAPQALEPRLLESSSSLIRVEFFRSIRPMHQPAKLSKLFRDRSRHSKDALFRIALAITRAVTELTSMRADSCVEFCFIEPSQPWIVGLF